MRKNVWIGCAFFLIVAIALLPSCAGRMPPAKPSGEVQVVHNVQYYDGPGADIERHSLDLYLPPTGQKWPVVIFIHGGAWTIGDKNAVANVGFALASKGYLAVLINYRLSPDVQHPSHVIDVSRAVAWVCRNVQRYGGHPDKIFLAGHSAGAHLAALVALDKEWLQKQGIAPKKIKGVICISGVYKLGTQKLLDLAFPQDPKIRLEASPTTYLTKKSVPFLVLYAANEIPSLDEQAEDFASNIREVGGEVVIARIPGTNHNTIVTKFGRGQNQTSLAVFRFLENHLK